MRSSVRAWRPSAPRRWRLDGANPSLGRRRILTGIPLASTCPCGRGHTSFRWVTDEARPDFLLECCAGLRSSALPHEITRRLQERDGEPRAIPDRVPTRSASWVAAPAPALNGCWRSNSPPYLYIPSP